MPESTLSVSLFSLAAEAGWFLGYNRTPSSWTGWQAALPYVPSSQDSQLGDVMAMVAHGLRMFYTPPALDPGEPPHRWSFLAPERTLTTVAGQTDYTLPDDHAYFEGDMTYDPSASYSGVVTRTGVGKIRELAQQSPGLVGKPQYFTDLARATDGSQGQRFAVAFWPKPDAVYTLTYRATVLPPSLSATNPYPYGGAQHAETILAAVLAACELHMNDEAGSRAADFRDRLRASVAADARGRRPEFLGYNGDRSDGRRVESNHTYANYATYNGSVPGP